MNIKSLLAKRVQGLKPSPIRKLVPIMRTPGMISFGGGYPNAQTFAFTSLDVVFKSGRRFTIQDKAVDMACQYGPTDASPDLKPHIIRWHADKDGVTLKAEQIQVLTGAQEGLHIMAYLFLNDEDSVIMSEPTYSGTLGAFRAFSERFIPVPLDAQGMMTAELERILAKMASAGERLPKFIYDIPNGHNPAGVSLSLERRRHLLEIASRYDLLILDELGYVPFSKEGAELLFQVLAERHERGSVVITTNLGFADWTQVFGDATMTAALLDRLTHKAYIIQCSWESYRLKQSLHEKGKRG